MKKFYTLKDIDALTTKELKQMDLATLRKVVSSERSVARKRIERIEESEIYSPAYVGIMRAGGIPSVKGMDFDTLMNEHKKYKTFLSAKTSTKKAAKQYQEDVEQSIKESVKSTVDFKDEKEKQSFMDALDDFIKENSGEIYKALDWFRDKNYTSFVNYKEIVGKIASKMMIDYGKGNRGAFFSGLKRELDKEIESMARSLSNTVSDFITVD